MVTFFFLLRNEEMFITGFLALRITLHYSVHFSFIIVACVAISSNHHKTVRSFCAYELKNNNLGKTIKHNPFGRKPTERRIMRWFWYYFRVTTMNKVQINFEDCAWITRWFTFWELSIKIQRLDLWRVFFRYTQCLSRTGSAAPGFKLASRAIFL